MVWHYSRVLAAAMTFALVLDSASGVNAQEKPADSKQQVKQQNIILISKETTYVTEPLDEEGYVDYVQAINDLYSKGVTPENNFEVVLRTVMPPGEISENLQKEYFTRLGLPVPGPEARFYQDFITFTLNGNFDNKVQVDRVENEWDTIISDPWTAAQHPQAVKWIAEYGPELDKLVEGSRRSKYYTPYLSGDDPDGEPFPRVLSILLGSAQQQREVARGLTIRAMGRIGEGELDGAWSDLQAMHRVARHVSEGFTLIESLVGYAIDAMAYYAEIDILTSPHLTADQTKRFLADLQALKPLPTVADKLDRGERFMGLDCVTMLARHGRKNGVLKMLELINDLSDATQESPFASYVAFQQDSVIKVDPRVGLIDWNMAMIIMNQWYDRLAEAAREPEYRQRQALFAAFQRDLEKLAKEVTGTNKDPLDLIAEAGPRKSKGIVIGKILVHLLLPACQAARTAEDMNKARREVIQLAFAVELSRRETGKWPESLRDLVPKYASFIPLDPCSGEPLHYRADKNGFLLYSVGRNGKDDDGHTFKDGNGDDYAVRIRE